MDRRSANEHDRSIRNRRANSPSWPGQLCSTQRPDIREQSYLLPTMKNACKPGGVHIRGAGQQDDAHGLGDAEKRRGLPSRLPQSGNGSSRLIQAQAGKFRFKQVSERSNFLHDCEASIVDGKQVKSASGKPWIGEVPTSTIDRSGTGARIAHHGPGNCAQLRGRIYVSSRTYCQQ